MEDLCFLCLIPYVVIIFVSPFILHLFVKNYRQSGSKTEFPPGKMGWPLIGENLDYFLKLRNCVPEMFLRERAEKYSTKIFKTSLIREPMAVFCGAEGNKFLFSSENKLVQLWWPKAINKIFPKSNGEFMKEDSGRVRKILQPFLKVDSLLKYIGTMDSVMKNHIMREWNCDEIKVSPSVTKFTFVLACRLFLSIEDLDQIEELGKPFGDISAGTVSLAIDFPGTAFNRAVKASKRMRKQLEEIVEKRKVDLLQMRGLEKEKDLLSQMLIGNEEYDQFLTVPDIASTMLGLLHAGTHTLNVALTFIMMYLAELPDVYNEVLREQNELRELKGPDDFLNWEDIKKMKYSWNVANEVLRLKPPSFGFFREAITDFTYAGYLIPKGWKLHLIAQATHRNHEYFPNPDKFDPSRFEGNGPPPYTFIPFGGGPRMCPGNEYARLVMLVFIHNVVTNFKWEKLIPNEKVVIDPLPRPTKGLPIRLSPHKL